MTLNTKNDILTLKSKIKKSISPLKPASKSTGIDFSFRITATRTDAGRSLPEYYLIYFLLVELLGFQDLGRSDKTAWSIPVEYNGQGFLIEHRKFGIGIFGDKNKEAEASEIVTLLKRGIKLATPFFDYLADRAVKNSKLNVKNRSYELFARYQYMLELYKAKKRVFETKSSETYRKKVKGSEITKTLYFPFQEKQQKSWLAVSVIDAFFAWTEHIFIHIALLQGKISTANEVAKLANEEWAIKFKTAINLMSPGVQNSYNKLVEIRRQVRNYLAHGAFGKQGEAFDFHSNAGAVPVFMPHKSGKAKFTFLNAASFDDNSAIDIIEKFIDILWRDERSSAKTYIQEANLPIILTMIGSGVYKKAMGSLKEMVQLVNYLTQLMDRSADMDF